MQNITVSLIQTSLFWEDPKSNLDLFTRKLSRIADSTDLIVLPEMFNTGFSMAVEKLAESMEGPTVDWMARSAFAADCVVTGSLIIREGGEYYNRLVWMRPDGSYKTYDKRHLFRMSGEDRHFRPGKQRIVVRLKDWRICPQICYDLRFPVWLRSRGDYDALLFIANWPRARSFHWRALLVARAIENQAYVIGVNRIGVDGNGLSYSGDSAVIDPQGNTISRTQPDQEILETVSLSGKDLEDHRQKFQAGLDADDFSLS